MRLLTKPARGVLGARNSDLTSAGRSRGQELRRVRLADPVACQPAGKLEDLLPLDQPGVTHDRAALHVTAPPLGAPLSPLQEFLESSAGRTPTVSVPGLRAIVMPDRDRAALAVGS